MKLTFRSVDGDTATLDVEVFNTPIAKKWYSALKQLVVVNDKVLQKNFNLLGSHNTYRTREDIVNDLKFALEILKDFDYDINEDFSPLVHSYDQNLLNILHNHFEKLQGQTWSPSPHLKRANGEQRYAISMLNFCCHELEAFYDTLHKHNQRPNIYFYYNFLGVHKRFPITLEDKMQFTREMTPGMVYLHYAQTGKTHYEAYLDEDDHVGIDNITEHRILTGEFCVYFGPGYTFPMDDKFKSWLTEKGFNPDDPDLALGQCPVGRIDLPEYEEFFKKYNDMVAIEVDGIVEEYPYRHNEDQFKERLLGVWREKK